MNNPLQFDHLAYVAAAYALFVAATAWLAVGARQRLASVTRKLRAADPRAAREDRS